MVHYLPNQQVLCTNSPIYTLYLGLLGSSYLPRVRKKNFKVSRCLCRYLGIYEGTFYTFTGCQCEFVELVVKYLA